MTKTLISLLSLCLLASWHYLGYAQGQQYEEGTHYVTLDIPVRTQAPDAVEVTEYFSYGCRYCFRLEPLIKRWQASLPADVVFNRTPALWNPQYAFLAQVYYTLDAMGALEKAHDAIFQGLHVQRRNILSPEAMAEYLESQGVDAKAFARTFNSFGVRSAIRAADARGRAYRASGVPTIIVNGKYRIETNMADSNATMLDIARFLVNKERTNFKGGTSRP